MGGEAALPTPVRVLIADDHPLAREGLRSMLLSSEPDPLLPLEVVGEAEDGRGALELCRELRPDLVLMDVRMPGMDGLQATREIKERCPKTAVLIVTTHESEEYLLEAVRAGAAGYVLKEATKGELWGAVRRVLDGESPMNQELAMRLLRRLAERPPFPPGQGGSADHLLPPSRVPSEEEAEQPQQQEEKKAEPSPLGALTPREVEIFRLMSEGHTNQQIAKNLFVSVSTVKKHVRQVFVKLGVSDRTQAALKAVEMGLGPKQER